MRVRHLERGMCMLYIWSLVPFTRVQPRERTRLVTRCAEHAERQTYIARTEQMYNAGSGKSTAKFLNKLVTLVLPDSLPPT